MTGSEPASMLARLLEGAVRSACEGVEEVAIAFSGGVDSGTLAHIASRYVQVHGYTVAVDADAPDARYAGELAALLDVEHTLIMPSRAEISWGLDDLVRRSGIRDMHTISFELPVYFVLDRCREERVLSGQGADELFGGYARYLRMGVEELRRALVSDAESVMETAEMERSLACGLGRALRHPYLSGEVWGFAVDLAPDRKISNGERKVVLREAARRVGVPEVITTRRKHALQYSSGFSKHLRQMRRSHHVETHA